MVKSALLVGLCCLATLVVSAPQQASEDSYSQAAANPQLPPLQHDPGAPDHGLAPPPADNVAPVARHLVVMVPAGEQPEQQGDELVREKRQYGFGGGYGGYGRRGYGRRHRYGGYGGYPGGYGGYGGYPGGYGGGYGGYPGGYGGGYPGGFGGGLGGSSAQSSAASQSFSLSGGFGPFSGSLSSSQASSSAGGFGFGR